VAGYQVKHADVSVTFPTVMLVIVPVWKREYITSYFCDHMNVHNYIMVFLPQKKYQAFGLKSKGKVLN